MKIDEIYSRKWSSADFIQTGVYRPGKQNVKIKTFVENMKTRGIDIKPNERFNYVIVKKYPYYYDQRGRKVSLSIGDKLELAEEYEKHKDSGN
jgi:abortive infection bacteriophage resistance protein